MNLKLMSISVKDISNFIRTKDPDILDGLSLEQRSDLIEIIEEKKDVLTDFLEKKKTTFDTVVSIAAIRNYIGSYSAPNVLALTNNYETCFNGFSFSRKGSPKIIHFNYECMANIFVWLPILLENYPKKITVEGKNRNVKSMVVMFFNRVIEEDALFVVTANSEKISTYDRGTNVREILKNNNLKYRNPAHQIFNVIGDSSPEDIKISIGLGLEEETKEKKEDFLSVSFPESSGFKDSSNRWKFFSNDAIFIQDYKDKLTSDGDFIWMIVTDFKPDNTIPKILPLDINIDIYIDKELKEDNSSFHVNKKYIKEFKGIITGPLKLILPHKFYRKNAKSPLILKNSVLKSPPIPKIQGLASKNGKFKFLYDKMTSDYLKKLLVTDYTKIIKKIMKNDPYLKESGWDIDIKINLNYINGCTISTRKGYYPCFAARTRRVLTFEIDKEENIIEDLFVDEIKDESERKKWETVWNILFIEKKEKSLALDKLQTSIEPILKLMKLTFDEFVNRLEPEGIFRCIIVEEGGWPLVQSSEKIGEVEPLDDDDEVF